MRWGLRLPVSWAQDSALCSLSFLTGPSLFPTLDGAFPWAHGA